MKKYIWIKYGINKKSNEKMFKKKLSIASKNENAIAQIKVFTDGLNNRLISGKEKIIRPWLGVISWLEHHSITERLWAQFSVRAHPWVVGSVSGLGTGRQLIDARLSH